MRGVRKKTKNFDIIFGNEEIVFTFAVPKKSKVFIRR